MRICPKCCSDKIMTERRIDGDSSCVDCNYKNKTAMFTLKIQNEKSSNHCSFKEFIAEKHYESSKKYTFKELFEIQQTGSKTDRDEYSSELNWNKYKNFCKLLITQEEYSLYKYHDSLFLIKNDEYIASLDGTIDKLNSKKAFYILLMHSNERNAMQKMYQLMKLVGFKLIVSDVLNSDDAVKHLIKMMKSNKYFGINYKDETVNVTDEELLNNPDLE